MLSLGLSVLVSLLCFLYCTKTGILLYIKLSCCLLQKTELLINYDEKRDPFVGLSCQWKPKWT